MKGELFKDHGEAWENIKAGLPLMLWGFFKKMVIADRTAVFVGRANSGTQYGLNVLICLVLYGIQLYCDFSGGIDVVRGVSECFGVRLDENFRQPYFSKDLGEFWRRWHISLGAFMKNYIFFPLAMWKPLKLLKKQLRKHMSMKMASKVIVAIGDLIVFLIVGIWHGAGSKYAGWGIYNGAILAFSAVMEDVYRSWKNDLHINEQSGRWQTFRLVRTLVIVTIGWVFDCADTAAGAVRMFFRMFLLNRTSLSRIFTRY
jgi:D-alanyl-lipoteichoic acid acyltransferase DltB (MBOAT superfamily)